jgi:hypothetical protein
MPKILNKNTLVTIASLAAAYAVGTAVDSMIRAALHKN